MLREQLDSVSHQLLELAAEAGRRGSRPDRSGRGEGIVAPNPEATQLYSEGLAKVVAEPSFALAHSTLAFAWSWLGYDARAQTEATRTLELSTNLPREHRLLVEGQYRETINEWDRAVQIYRTLYNFFPDSLEHGFRLAKAQTDSNKPQDALATVAALRKLPPLRETTHAMTIERQSPRA